MNIAFISAAHVHTKGYIEKILKATDGRRVAVVWDDLADRGRRHAEMAGAPFEPDLAKVLADPAVDGFAICAENTRHLPLLKQTLRLGKPVFCEKPIVTNLEDLREVRALIAQYPDTPLICGYFQPWTDQNRAVMAKVNAGAVGKINRIRYRNAHNAAYGRWFDHPDYQWFHDLALSGGGAVMDMGSHALHLMRTFFGPVKEVWADIGNQSGMYPAVDDYGIVHLRFASGVLGTVEASWTQTGGIGGFEVIGSEKAIWNTPRGYLITGSDEPIPPLEDGLIRINRLVAVHRGEITREELRADLEAAMDTVVLTGAAYESAKTGRWVEVG